MTPVTIAAALAASRIFALREAVVATFARLFPELHVVGHPGKLDIADIVAGDVFRVPAFAVAASRVHSTNGPSSGLRDTPVQMACYIVVEDITPGTPPRLIKRDELALALVDAVVALLEDAAGEETRWGLDDLGWPEQVEAQPVFTAASFSRGVVFWAVTWRQTVRSGAPLWDMTTIAPADAPPPPLIEPGDPNYPVALEPASEPAP